jgi:uncharacterized protein (DUF2461 family)
MRVLIEELDVPFARSAPEITGDPKESMFRIYRDIPGRRMVPAERSL